MEAGTYNEHAFVARWREQTRIVKWTRGRVESNQGKGKPNNTDSGDDGRKYKSRRQQGKGVGI